jgi:hypothetical protein
LGNGKPSKITSFSEKVKIISLFGEITPVNRRLVTLNLFQGLCGDVAKVTIITKII